MFYILNITTWQLGELSVRSSTIMMQLDDETGEFFQEVNVQLKGPNNTTSLSTLLQEGFCKELETVLEDCVVTDLKMCYNQHVVDWCNINNIPVPNVLNRKSNNFIHGLVFHTDEAAMQFKRLWPT